MYRNFILIVIIFLSSKYTHCFGKIPKDSVPRILLQEVVVFANPQYHRKYYQQFQRDRRLEYNIRKVYPYAKLAASKILEIENNLQNLDDKRNKNQYVREQYKRLMKEFKLPLTKLTITQGKLLIKLIDRETSSNAFSHIKQYRGGFNAQMWQTFALIFGHNLRTKYQPLGKDKNIEQIVRQIEKGNL